MRRLMEEVPMRLENKVALITGSTGGMGRASARLFAKEGATVVVTSRGSDRADALLKEITDGGGKAIFIELDVTEQDQWTAAVDQVRKQFGALHVLMNIVGSNDLAMLPEVDIDAWNKIFEIDVTATLRGMQTCAPLMKDSGGGSIINIGSVAGITGNFSTAYSSSVGVRRPSTLGRLRLRRLGNPLQRHPAGLHRDGHDGEDDVQPRDAQDVRTHDEQHGPAQEDRQSRRDRLHRVVPGQRRIVVHHRDRHRGRRRLVLVRSLPRQRAVHHVFSLLHTKDEAQEKKEEVKDFLKRHLSTAST